MSLENDVVSPINKEDLAKIENLLAQVNLDFSLNGVLLPVTNALLSYEHIVISFEQAFLNSYSAIQHSWQEFIAQFPKTEKPVTNEFEDLNYEQLQEIAVDEGSEKAVMVAYESDDVDVDSVERDLLYGSSGLSEGRSQFKLGVEVVSKAIGLESASNDSGSFLIGTTKTIIISEAQAYANSETPFSGNLLNQAQPQAQFAFKLFEALAQQDVSISNALKQILSVSGFTDESDGVKDGVITFFSRYGVFTLWLEDGRNKLMGDWEFSLNLNLLKQIADATQEVTDQIGYLYIAEDGTTKQGFVNFIIDLNDAPTAQDDIVQLSSNQREAVLSIESNILINDDDPDFGDIKQVVAVNGLESNVGTLLTLDSGAQIIVNADGTVQYFTNGVFSALGEGQTAFDGVTYTMADAEGLTSSAQIIFNIIGVPQTVPPPVPPVVLDLDGDGNIVLISADDSHVLWDLSGHGDYHELGWVGINDGILIYDQDNDNKVTSLNEFSLTYYAPESKTDLEALRDAFDTNHDNVFDSQDKDFAQFKVWQDKNGNGISDEGELNSLTMLGIKSISLISDNNVQLVDGNVIYGVSSFETNDGNTHLVFDVGLTVGEKQVNSLQEQDVLVQNDLDLSQISDPPAALPTTQDSPSFNVPDAISINDTTASFVGAPTATELSPISQPQDHDAL